MDFFYIFCFCSRKVALKTGQAASADKTNGKSVVSRKTGIDYWCRTLKGWYGFFMQLGEYFIANGLITREELERALQAQKENPQSRLGHILVSMGVLQMKDLYRHIKGWLETKQEEGKVQEEAYRWISDSEIESPPE